ncbi:NAD(P)H-dependent oxidoreductase [Halotalea alkalilenta]|uniref:NAD(P)H-dependent oxidoreductase n=1 Tax=Halotalea alkalilenta TaxID=376489 RepID=UPI0004852DE3|nr:NAD(P)H-dependent oxidoreductase [Halotalea alkalilenta]
MHVVVIHGSPSAPSRSSALAEHLAERLEALGIDCDHARLEQFSAASLLGVDTSDPAIREYLAKIDRARGVIIATPVYTGSITALTKSLLEVIPERHLRGRPALVLASGGSAASVQAAEHALAPILRNLKATLLGASVYTASAELPSRKDESGKVIGYRFEPPLAARLEEALEHFLVQLAGPPSSVLPAAWTSRLAL